MIGSLPRKIAKTDVVRVEKGKTTREIYEEKKAALKPGDAEAIYQLSLWCQEQKLGKEARQHLEDTIKVDPDHEKDYKKNASAYNDKLTALHLDWKKADIGAPQHSLDRPQRPDTQLGRAVLALIADVYAGP